MENQTPHNYLWFIQALQGHKWIGEEHEAAKEETEKRKNEQIGNTKRIAASENAIDGWREI